MHRERDCNTVYRLKDASHGVKAQDFGKALMWFLVDSTETMNDLLDGVCCTLDLDSDMWRLCNDLMGKLDS